MSTADSSQPDPVALRRVVLNQGGVDPTDVEDLLNIFVDGVFNNAWRSGPIEDVHATKWGPSDGQMFRMNTFLINELRTVTASWKCEHGVSNIDRLSIDAFDTLIERYRGLLVDGPVFVTPMQTVEVVARRWARTIREHADQSLYALRSIADVATPAAAIYGRVLEGTYFRGAWGASGWDERVDSFIQALDSPDDELWRFGNRDARIARLAGLDLTRLSDLLRHSPWDLSENEADGVIEAGIGFVKDPRRPQSR